MSVYANKALQKIYVAIKNLDLGANENIDQDGNEIDTMMPRMRKMPQKYWIILMHMN